MIIENHRQNCEKQNEWLILSRELRECWQCERYVSEKASGIRTKYAEF